LPYYRVRNYVKYEMLPKELQALVDDRRVTLNEAVRAARLSERPDGTFDTGRAVAFALEMKVLSPEQRHRLEELQRERPGATAEELVEEAKKTRRTERITIILAAKWIDGLDKAAEDMAKSREEIAGFAIMDWLSVKGYV